MKMSSPKLASNGVTQGMVLETLQLLIYIIEALNRLPQEALLVLADDIAVVHCFKPGGKFAILDRISSDLTVQHIWNFGRFMKFCPKKRKVISPRCETSKCFFYRNSVKLSLRHPICDYWCSMNYSEFII